MARTLPEQLTPSLVDQAALMLQDLVRGGAALCWVDPSGTAEVADLLGDVAADVEAAMRHW